MNDLTLSVKKTINASTEDVFDAWLDPGLLAQFILPMPGMPQPQVENDPVQGGNFTIIMQVGDNKIPHTGQYLEIDRPHKLVFSWESPFSLEASTVTINFSATDNGATVVELIHVRFIDEEARSNHEGGWVNILEMLDEALQVHVPV
jgi:uncharacterized protein YndB with AHSA1/START domain